MSASVEVVRQAYEAFKSYDADALVALSDPGIEFGISAAVPGGTYRGHTGVRRYIKEIEATFGDQWDSEIVRAAEAGQDRVIIVARVFGQGKGGVPLEMHVSHIWELRDGKLLRGTVYPNPEDALAALDAAPTP